MRRVAPHALLTAVLGLAGGFGSGRFACAGEDKPALRIPAGLRERLRAAESEPIRSEPREAFPSFPGPRAETDVVDVSTTGSAARLAELLVLAHKARVALGWWLGPGKMPRLNIVDQPLVFCRDVERRAWLKRLQLPSEVLAVELSLVWNYHAGIHVVASEPEEGLEDPARARRAAGSATAAVTQDFLRAVYPKWPSFCREGLRFVVCAVLTGTTMHYVVSPSEYDKGGRAYHASGLRVIATAEEGPVFNPHYLTGLIAKQRDDDLRLLLGKEYDTLTADDDVKAYFFVRWLMQEVDPQGTLVRAWFQAMADGKEDPDTATRRLFPDVKGERVLEAVDARFREQHARAHPLPAYLQRDWTGTWAPTAESLGAWNKEARRNRKPLVRSVRLELNPDGTWVETLDLDPGDASELRGTWELHEGGIHLKGNRFTGKGRTEMVFFQTRSLQEGELVWLKKKAADR